LSDPGAAHPLWLGAQPLVLASSSRTRFELLIAAGIPVEVTPADVDERAIAAPLEKSGASATLIAATLGAEKAMSVSKNLSVSKKQHGRYVLGADQTLSCEGVMLHKPLNRADAAAQLARLSGRSHHLYSAVALVLDQQVIASFVGTAKLTMRKLSHQMIERYLDAAGDTVMQSVGGYQLERTGLHLFSRIRGDHTTILGLPMLETLVHLRKHSLIVK
jgi:septum formation protein